jgi:hypothetical protein
MNQDNRLYFCSEGVLWALQTVYPEALNYLTPDKCMPADFLSHPNEFEIVWEGYLPGRRVQIKNFCLQPA